jgi:hypothetical protein
MVMWKRIIARMEETDICMLKFIRQNRNRRPRSIFEDNFIMAIKKIGYDDVDWINRAQDMVHGSYKYGNEPSYSMKSEEFHSYLSDY